MAARILVIEDNPANLALVEYLLGYAGYSVLTAADGGAGMRVAREQRPDLILCDLQMPVMNGYEVLESIRNDPLFDRIKVVALTAYSMPEDKDLVAAAGFTGYLTKPIEPETFVRQIEEYLPAELRTVKPPSAS